MAEEKNKQLSNVTAELSELNSHQMKGNAVQIKSHEVQLKQLDVLQNISKIFQKQFDYNVLQDKLRKRKETGGSAPGGKPDKPPTPGGSKDDLESVGSIGEMIAAIAGAVAGLAAGIVAGLAAFAKWVGKKLIPKSLQTKISKLWKSVTTKLSKFFTSIGKTIDKVIKGIQKPFKALSKSASNSKVGKLVKSFSKLIGQLTAPFKAAIAPLKVGLSQAKSFFKIFKSFAKFFQPLGKIIGKWFAPIIITIDFLKSAFDIFNDESKGMGEKIFRILMEIPKKIGSFFLEIPDMVKNGFSWLFKKLLGEDNMFSNFLDGFSFVEMWEKAMDSLTDFFVELPEKFKNIGKAIGSFAYDAFEWVKDKVKATIKLVMDGIANLVTDPVGTMTKIIMMPATLLTKAVAWVLGKLGFDDISEKLKSLDYAKTMKNIILAPARLVKKAVSWVLGKLGFGEDGEGEGDISATEKEEEGILSKIMNILLLPGKMLGKAINYVIDLFSWDNLKASIGGVGSMISAAADWVSGLLGDAIQWFKDKLSFFGGGDDTPTEFTGTEDIDQLKDMDVLKNTGKWDPFDAKIDESAIQGLTSAQLDMIAAEYPDKGGYKDLHKQIRAEKERRAALASNTGFEKFSDEGLYEEIDKLQGPGRGTSEEDQKRLQDALDEAAKRDLISQAVADSNRGTLQTAMQPEEIIEVDEKYTPSAIISGTQQQAVAQSDEMRAGQAVYDENKGPVRQGGDVNTSVNAPTTNNQTINNTYTQSNQPSTRDDTDQMYIFRATGTSR